MYSQAHPSLSGAEPCAPKRSGIRLRAFAALFGLLLAGCGGGVGGGGVGAAVCVSSGTSVAGAVLYQDRQYDLDGFIDRPMKPVRYATVELWQEGRSQPVASSRTNRSGGFCITTAQSLDQAYVRVKAEALVEGRRLAVVDNHLPVSRIYYTDTDPSYVIAGEINTIPTVQIEEGTQWIVNGFPVDILGGAFNILDVMTSATRFVGQRWGQDLGNITAQWASNLGGTHYHPGQARLHIGGLNAGDSNEYDDDIILHEFGHHVMHTISRDTSPGGLHYINGYTYDVRLAFSEGFASFFSTLLRDIEPGAYSNRSTMRASMVDAFSLTEGGTGALRFAYELSTPQAYVPDKRSYTGEPEPVTPAKFTQLVKRNTSEVSVAAALWDIYAGTSTFTGVGQDGILDLILAIPGRYPDGQIGFSQFWEVVRNSTRFSVDELKKVRTHLISDRKMALIPDVWGGDGTVAQLQELAASDDRTGYSRHLFAGLAVGIPKISSGHSLFPASDEVPDEDFYILEVAGAAEFEITTTHINNGTDTYMELLAADGTTVIADNDNYVPYSLFLGIILDTGEEEWVSFIEYNGSCSLNLIDWPWGIWSEAQNRSIFPNICPPNAANPLTAVLDAFEIPEYLASRITAELDPGTYYIRVTSSPDRPPSSSPYGGYDLTVTLTTNILP